MAIFRFFLKVGVSSHAGRPPGIAADRQITKSLRIAVVAECSLQKKSHLIAFSLDQKPRQTYQAQAMRTTYFACNVDVHDVITAWGTGCSTNNIRMMNCRAISGNSLEKRNKRKTEILNQSLNKLLLNTNL